MVTRVAIAIAQLAGVTLVFAAVWNLVDMWAALLLVGVTLCGLGIGAERATIDR